MGAGVFPSSEATIDEDGLPPTGRNVDFDYSESFTSGLHVSGLSREVRPRGGDGRLHSSKLRAEEDDVA